MSNYTEVLSALDYPYKDMGNYLLTQAKFRNGETLGSVAIYKNGKVVDFVTGKTYKWTDFVSLCSGQLVNGQDLLKEIEINNPTPDKPLLDEQKLLDEDLIKNLVPDHTYWIKRGISEETLVKFKGGLCLEGRMKNRYVLPIFNSKNKLVGVTGRDVSGSKYVKKWLHNGQKNKWIWPAQINLQDLKEKKEVVLVESPGCVLSLFEADVKNILCLFGIKLSGAMISFLIKLDPKRLIISLNNELNENGGVGNRASEEVRNTLTNYFDSDRVIIKLPKEKDFNKNFDKSAIQAWYKEI